MLVDGGEVTVSVPVIGGPPLLLKEANQALLFRRRSDYSARELLAASLAGRPAPQPDDIRVTHKGFDFRRLLDSLGERFEVIDTACTPFRALPWWLNSQVFARLRPRPLNAPGNPGTDRPSRVGRGNGCRIRGPGLWLAGAASLPRPVQAHVNASPSRD